MIQEKYQHLLVYKRTVAVLPHFIEKLVEAKPVPALAKYFSTLQMQTRIQREQQWVRDLEQKLA